MSPQPIYLDEKSDAQLLLPLVQEDELPQPQVPQVRSRNRRRKWRLFTSMVLTWITFFTLSDYIRYQFRRLYESKVVVEDTAMAWPVPPDITLGECAQWEEGFAPRSRAFLPYDFTSVASFELPISSETLFFLARGSVAGGIKVQYGSHSKDVKIGVKAHYKFQDDLDQVQVCVATRGEGENGLGIFSPRFSGRHIVGFEVTVILPSAPEGSNLNIKAFETDLPLFTHDIGDLNGSVHFESIDLKTSNMPIHVQSLEAEKATVITSNSPVKGEFHVSSSLAIITSNSPVDVQVTLFNDDGGEFTDLQIATANANIKGAFTLESANETGGKFKVSAKTANAPIDLVFIDAPVDSTLNLKAHTAMAPATVSLHKTYEGSFTATSSFQRPRLIVDREAEDPAGKGRTRKVQTSIRGTTESGTVRWSDGDDSRELLGSVSVQTAFAPLTLKL